jgi:S1-C subfamily serine protease
MATIVQAPKRQKTGPSPFNLLGLYFPSEEHDLPREQIVINDALAPHGHTFVARTVACTNDILDITQSEAWRFMHLVDANNILIPRLQDPAAVLLSPVELIFFCSCFTYSIAEKCIRAGLPYAIAPSQCEIFWSTRTMERQLLLGNSWNGDSFQVNPYRPVEGGFMVKGTVTDDMCITFSCVLYSELAKGAILPDAFAAASTHTAAQFPPNIHGKFELLQNADILETYSYMYRGLGECTSSLTLGSRTISASTTAPSTQPHDTFSKSVVMIGFGFRSTSDLAEHIYNFHMCGTGTFITATGLVLTAWHVIKDADGGCMNLIAMSNSWREDVQLAYMFKIVASDPATDSALLQITHSVVTTTLCQQRTSRVFRLDSQTPLTTGAQVVSPMPLANSDLVSLGDPVCLPGFPGIDGWSLTTTDGHISGYSTQAHSIHPGPWFKLAAAVNAGQSGAPLVSKQTGCCIGIMNIATSPIYQDGVIHVNLPNQHRLVDLLTRVMRHVKSAKDLASKEALNHLKPINCIAERFIEVRTVIGGRRDEAARGGTK